MEQLTDLKAILHSKRANIYYLDKCRVMQKDGRVLYLTKAKEEKQYWNIPIANTTVILLGNGYFHHPGGCSDAGFSGCSDRFFWRRRYALAYGQRDRMADTTERIPSY